MNLDWQMIVGIAAVVTAAAAAYAWLVSTRPSRDRAEAGWDAILGKGAVRDKSGAIMEVGQPGLVHRVSELETTVHTLANVVADQREIREDIKTIKIDVKALQDARLETLVTRAESAQMWRAVADKDVDPK